MSELHSNKQTKEVEQKPSGGLRGPQICSIKMLQERKLIKFIMS